MPMTRSADVIVLSEPEIRALVPLDVDALGAIERAFAALAEGHADVPPIVGLFVPDRSGEVDVKGAYIRGWPRMAIKIASGFYENGRLGLPSGSGMMVVVSAETGFPEGVLLDNGYLTEVRTGLAGAVAAKYLAPDDVDTVGVIGAGSQGRYQVRALRLVRRFRRVLVFDRTDEAAEAYAREMRAELDLPVEPADAEAVVRESHVVISCTPSREPTVRASWLHAGMHITGMGADTAGKQELESAVLARADRLACDYKRQCFERGEFLHAIQAGAIDLSADVTELGDLTSGRRPGRQRPDEITVCALTGVGVQDAAIACLCYERAIAAGVGLKVPRSQ
jgi:ornithine cyclodeaminase